MRLSGHVCRRNASSRRGRPNVSIRAPREGSDSTPRRSWTTTTPVPPGSARLPSSGFNEAAADRPRCEWYSKSAAPGAVKVQRWMGAGDGVRPPRVGLLGDAVLADALKVLVAGGLEADLAAGHQLADHALEVGEHFGFRGENDASRPRRW